MRLFGFGQIDLLYNEVVQPFDRNMHVDACANPIPTATNAQSA